MVNKMLTFQELTKEKNIQEFIKVTFDVEFQLSGDWGYNQNRATTIHALPKGMPLKQLQHTFATIRAHLEMNLSQTKETRYGGINTNEKSSTTIKDGNHTFEKVIYEITAIQEELYNKLIKEYKAGYENRELDLDEHFKKRKEATLVREVVHYFEISNL